MTTHIGVPDVAAPAPQNGRRPSRAERQLADERAKIARLKLQQEAEQQRAFAAEEWKTERARIREASRRQRNAAKSLRRADQWAKAKVVLEQLRHTLVLVGAIVGVNLVAVAGQVTAFHEGFAWTLLSALAAAAVIESIAIYVGWHAHIALIEGDSVFRLRAASYGIAVIVGGLNYHHYAPDWLPTDKAVMFGLASLLSPWLWAIHSRHVHRRQLRAAGLIDPRAPKFSFLRWLLHHRETWRALKWAVRHGEQSPAVAITAVQMEQSQAVEDAALAAARAEIGAGWAVIAASQSAALDVAANHNADLEDLIHGLTSARAPEVAPANTSVITSPDGEVMNDAADEDVDRTPDDYEPAPADDHGDAVEADTADATESGAGSGEPSERTRPDDQDNRKAEVWIWGKCRGRNGRGTRPTQADVNAKFGFSPGWAQLRLNAVQERMTSRGYKFEPGRVVLSPSRADTGSNVASVRSVNAEEAAEVKA